LSIDSYHRYPVTVGHNVAEMSRRNQIGLSPYNDVTEGNSELLRIETIDDDLAADQRAESILNGPGPNVIAGQCRWLVHDEGVLAGAHGRGHGTDTGAFDCVGQLRARAIGIDALGPRGSGFRDAVGALVSGDLGDSGLCVCCGSHNVEARRTCGGHRASA